MAEVVREQLAPLVARLEALEGTTGRAAAVPPAARRADVNPARAEVRGKAPGQPQRGLPEEVTARIAELHRAGRSAYAISQELGVSYDAVRARVRALAAAG